MHVGVITSSLGGHGGGLCSEAVGTDHYDPAQNDRGRLLTRTVDGGSVPTWNDFGFLSWDPRGYAANPPGGPAGEADASALGTALRDLVRGAGERGCGYASTLEAWYRFLIDPEPPLDVTVDPDTQQSEPVGLDEQLLAQRAAFLRPDSVVVIVMLTNQDDCSIRDDGYGHLVTALSEGSLPRSTRVCETDPNDPCCLSCSQATWPDGCADPRTDSVCQAGLLHSSTEDRLGLRCWQQRRRFGVDLLYPVSRYVAGLSNLQIEGRDGTPLANPLFAPSAVYPDRPVRMDGGSLLLTGIVGVPWQDVATDESLTDPDRLDYLSATEIAQRGIWNDVLGEPTASPPVLPDDPFVIESVEPRSGHNPRTGIGIEPPRPGAGGDAINGHEYSIVDRDELQYARIFPLVEPRDCSDREPGPECPCAGRCRDDRGRALVPH